MAAKKGRSPLTKPEIQPVELNHQVVEQASNAMNVLAGAHSQFSGAYSIANRRFGQYLAHAGYKTIAAAAAVMQLVALHESNEFKYIEFIGPDNSPRTAATWEQFCEECLGRSSSSVREEIQQVMALGDAYDGFKRAGLTRRQIRAVLKAPEEKRLEIISGEAVDINDPDALRELAEELAVQLENQKKETEEAKKQYETSDTLVAEKNKQLDALALKLKKAPKLLPFNDRANDIGVVIAACVADGDAAFELIAQSMDAVENPEDGIAEPTEAEMGSIVKSFEDAAARLMMKAEGLSALVMAFKNRHGGHADFARD